MLQLVASTNELEVFGSFLPPKAILLWNPEDQKYGASHALSITTTTKIINLAMQVTNHASTTSKLKTPYSPAKHG